MSLGHFLVYTGFFDRYNPGMDLLLIILMVSIWVGFGFFKKQLIYPGMVLFTILSILFGIRQFGVCNMATSINRTGISVNGIGSTDENSEPQEIHIELRYEDIASVSYDKENKVVVINTKSGDCHQWTLSGKDTLLPFVGNAIAGLKYEGIKDSL